MPLAVSFGAIYMSFITYRSNYNTYTSHQVFNIDTTTMDSTIIPKVSNMTDFLTPNNIYT